MYKDIAARGVDFPAVDWVVQAAVSNPRHYYYHVTINYYYYYYYYYYHFYYYYYTCIIKN